jgi:4-hydroxythreonine-4-phosphate dehydrogenase
MRILVTQGEPRGIGPELVLKALPRFRPPAGARVTVLGDPDHLARVADDLGLPRLEDVLPVAGESPALAALEEAARMAGGGEADAVVTAPVNKARLKAAGFEFPGQTEFFAARLGAAKHAMLLTDGRLRVVPMTIHVALNPHAGEEGHFGDEEERVIAPAIRLAREEGADVDGPLPGDVAFAPRVRERYDALLGMYHDQALGPFKALAAGGGVNVTLGLPVVRTSPDHGTAEDIAGKGVADHSSMLMALETAVTTVANRRRS